ncbi:helix-turn-helix domain-containing protein [Pseudoflavitalea sp. G-6-1-2]|uniref:AraC family transcriptional regulator n=1 Tax=Pseudoflavitalea sp. G-6-1-2 TaxID=2728841 RepID=UPI001469CE98|nr:helix-turn-helix transcriptional regulator [Pseudoflavitalea sp. G-6-1-2]NML23488.1 helix-turn-helix domain-containing protein [Pseudoflavitalea sp. G-6-1-2]
MKSVTSSGIPVYSGKGIPGDFYVDCFEKANIWQLSPHRRTFYQVIFFREGTGKQQVDFKLYLSEGPALVLLSPNQVHQMDISTNARGHMLMLPESFFEWENPHSNSFSLKSVFDNIDCFPFLEVDKESAMLLDSTIRQMQRAMQFSGSMQKMILMSYVKIFLLHIYQLRQQKTREDNPDKDFGQRQFRQFKMLIESDFRNTHQPNVYAAKMHVSLKHLNTISRKYGHASAGDLIKQRIMLEAKRYLFHDTLPVKELAYLLGFDDPDYFNRYFKKVTGVSPGSYRKRLPVILPAPSEE